MFGTTFGHAITMLIYWWGGLFVTFGLPQFIVLTGLGLSYGYDVALLSKDKQPKNNLFVMLPFSLINFAALCAGGFFTPLLG
jgi:hypothetical protein